ncbi:MAG: cytochrome b5 domain-containing protein [Sulfurimonas sp.]|jgi:predicted heme/steroid binding protein|uniref:cytochrome b5 domain-containing protein n=1 Tax=Sulfurimonas sp. TaxID=2022749 RepID=UPI0026373FE3|nr:cytochrome b5 domain-containing protein [Sulfurimonas sp.]MDD3477214.1 cytochrome b5 domain-containing protein [Sulfurimonas sp.]HUH41601.1 cytochrome b5 domain-containing protein [Sulfurimonas sp.]
MTLDELKLYDGKNGAKAYIAYKGVVYDVTQSPLWKNGEHQKRHSAGADLTLILADAPHGEEVFKRYPAVGTLDKD